MLHIGKIINAIVPEHAVLLAGFEGKNKIITNIHTIENLEAAKFIKVNELILITGVGLNPNDTLEKLVTAISQKMVAGIVINKGFYIKNIPEKVIQSCDHANIPLIALPWKYVLSDLQKIVFKELIASQYRSDYHKYLLAQLLHATYLPHINYNELLQFEIGEQFYVVDIEFMEKGILPASLAKAASALKHSSLDNKSMEILQEEERLILIIHGKKIDNLHQYEKQIQVCLDLLGFAYRAGIGERCEHWTKLSESFEEAKQSIRFASEMGHPEPFLVTYQDITILKIVKGMGDRPLLEHFVKEVLGKLIDYDEKNDADFCHFLQIWIKYSGNPQKVSSELFIHRNTVAYRINKVKSILGYEELTYPVISNLFFAFLLCRIL